MDDGNAPASEAFKLCDFAPMQLKDVDIKKIYRMIESQEKVFKSMVIDKELLNG